MSKKIQKKVPEVRFAGFTDDWEQRRLGEVLRVNSGRDYKHLSKGSIPVYGTGGYMLSVDKELSNCDGIGIGRKGTIDKPQYLSAPFWTVDTLFFMTPFENYDIKFLFSMTQIVNWKKLDESTGVPSLSKSVIEKLEQNFPSIKEQEIIGLFFKQLDNTIALHQRKLDQLKQLKQAYLKSLFPQNTERVPDLRFMNFEDVWRKKKLGEVARFYSGGTPSIIESKYYNGNIPFIRSAEINSNRTELFISDDGLNNSSAKLVKRGDILYALYGATSGEVGISKINGAINQAILAIQPIDEYYPYFIMQWLRKEKTRIIDKYLQGGQGNLSGSIVKELVILFPCYAEQQKIGIFFKQMDRKINLYQSKIEKIQSLKKIYLQKMFI